MTFQLDKFVISLMLLGLIVLVGALVIGDVNNTYSDYGANMTAEDFNDTYNKINELFEITEGMQNDTFGGEIDSGGDELDSAIGGSYSALRLIRNTFGLFRAMVTDAADLFKVNPIFITFAIAIVIALIVFAIIYLVLRFRP